MQIQAEAVQQRDMVVLGHITGGVGGWWQQGALKVLLASDVGTIEKRQKLLPSWLAAVTPRHASLLLMRCRTELHEHPPPTLIALPWFPYP